MVYCLSLGIVCDEYILLIHANPSSYIQTSEQGLMLVKALKCLEINNLVEPRNQHPSAAKPNLARNSHRQGGNDYISPNNVWVVLLKIK